MSLRLVFTPQSHRDLARLEDFLWHAEDPLANELLSFVLDGLQVLTHQPGIGRPVGAGLRELVINRGRGGYLARYRWDQSRRAVIVLRIRHQREAGYADDEV